MMISSRSLVLALSLTALAAGPARADTTSPNVIELPSLGGGESDLYDTHGVTNDGVVVGDATLPGDTNYSHYHAFRWSASGGIQDLGTLGGTLSTADAVTPDGMTVVGDSTLTGDSIFHAFVWRAATGMTDLGTLGGQNSYATDITPNAQVIVGYSEPLGAASGDVHAFRWTQATGFVDLGTLGGTQSDAIAVSTDGNTIVGFAEDASDNSHAFRWVAGAGMADLGTFGGSYSGAETLSADGSVVGGYAYLTGDVTYHAFRWTQTDGLVDLGTLGGSNSQTDGLSADGTIAVGYSDIPGDADNHAFRWTQATGMQDLNTLLRNAGVDMTGIDLQYAEAISPDGKLIAGDGSFADSPAEAFLVCYDPKDGCVGLTTAASQVASTEQLGAHQRAEVIEGRTTANEVLGMTRPMDDAHYVQAGALIGSAVGYASGQWAGRGVTLLGGIAYGAQDYPSIAEGDAPTMAGAVRYTFDDPFPDAAKALHPYAEIGAWVTPHASLTLSRSYMNGAGTDTASGTTDAVSWAEYGRGGLIWELGAQDQLTGYGEIGQQYMHFDAYSEDTTNNPFSASVGAGLFRMDVARVGGLWTHRLDDLESLFYPSSKIPVSLTLAGAVARSFDVHSGLTATIVGVGATDASNESDLWGEYGGRIEAQVTKDLAVDLDLTGTTGGDLLGTTLHGGVAVSYKF